MEYVLYHSGYSPILRELRDGSAGLTDAEGRVVIVGGGIQFHFAQYRLAVEAVLARTPARTPQARRQLHQQRSLQGRQLARARHGRGHAVLPRRKRRRFRRQRRAQGRCRRIGAGLVGRGRARDLPRRAAAAAGAVPERRRDRPRCRGDHRQQQPHPRHRAGRSARAGRRDAHRRRAACGVVRRIRRRHGARGDGEPHGSGAPAPRHRDRALERWRKRGRRISRSRRRPERQAGAHPCARDEDGRAPGARFLGLVGADGGAGQSRHLDGAGGVDARRPRHGRSDHPGQ